LKQTDVGSCRWEQKPIWLQFFGPRTCTGIAKSIRFITMPMKSLVSFDEVGVECAEDEPRYYVGV
jgi:hypothetical protein